MNHLPPDVGDGSVCASFTADGSWLSVGTTDPDLGFVELSGMPPFRDADRGDVAAVRAYRLLMEDASTAFLRVRGAAPVRREASGGAVTQAYAVSGDDPVVVEFAGRLDRPAYAEVTDVSPLPAIDLDSRASVDGRRLRVRSTAGIGACIDVEQAGASVRWVATSPNTATLELAGGANSGFTVTVAVGRDTAVPTAAAAQTGNLVDDVASSWLVVPDRHRATVVGIADAALRYSLGCTVLTAGDGFRTILTDHRILPLSWTRDAYYQARALLAAGVAGEAVGAHLRWLWLCCDRPDHLWQRSHQANGKVKDVAVQADQQLYPILELLDHRDVLGTGRHRRRPRVGSARRPRRGTRCHATRRRGCCGARRTPPMMSPTCRCCCPPRCSTGAPPAVWPPTPSSSAWSGAPRNSSPRLPQCGRR